MKKIIILATLIITSSCGGSSSSGKIPGLSTPSSISMVPAK